MNVPLMSGSDFFNYKGTFSIVLMAIVDSSYKFIYVDAGSNGRMSDGGVFGNCSFNEAIINGSLQLPTPSEIKGTNIKCPYMFVADEAFPLHTYIMKPYPRRNLDIYQRIFNYRLSRARRVVENAFGILSSRFRVFHSVISLEPDKVEKIVHASCALHNLLRSRAEESYLPSGSIDMEDADHRLIPGAWRCDPQLSANRTTFRRNSSQDAKAQRDMLSKFFMSEAGQVEWQLNMI